MPMTSPSRLARAPPALPGLMGASVWIMLIEMSVLLPLRGRSTALMMPAVTLWANPKGLPLVVGLWPTGLLSGSRRGTGRVGGGALAPGPPGAGGGPDTRAGAGPPAAFGAP